MYFEGDKFPRYMRKLETRYNFYSVYRVTNHWLIAWLWRWIYNTPFIYWKFRWFNVNLSQSLNRDWSVTYRWGRWL
jgi:hypothetical protein